MCNKPTDIITDEAFDKFLDDNAELIHSLAESSYKITKDDEWNDPKYDYENFVAKKEDSPNE